MVKKGSSKSASKNSITIFRDEGGAGPSEAAEATAKSGKGKAASKSPIAVFRDEDEPTAEASVPSTPRFVPFRDEDVRCFFCWPFAYDG